MTNDHPLADEAFYRRLVAMEARLRYLCKTDEPEFERVTRGLQESEPKLMCWLAYRRQTAALDAIRTRCLSFEFWSTGDYKWEGDA